MNYPKIFRIPVPSFKETRGKHYLSIEEGNIYLAEWEVENRRVRIWYIRDE